MNLALTFTDRRDRFIPPLLSVSPLSKLAQDNRMESPIPILPLSTPDADTEKLIKMKDEEVRKSLDFFFNKNGGGLNGETVVLCFQQEKNRYS